MALIPTKIGSKMGGAPIPKRYLGSPMKIVSKGNPKQVLEMVV